MRISSFKTNFSNHTASKSGTDEFNSSKGLHYVRDTLYLSQEQLARLLKVSSRTVARWEKARTGPERPEHKERLLHLKQIIDLGKKVYSIDGLREFFITPLPEFGNKTALDMVSIGDFEAVLGALASDYEGLGY